MFKIVYMLTKKEDWYESIMYFFFTVAGSLIPLYLGPFLLELYSVNYKWTDFIDKGELALFSASFLAPSLFIAVKNRKTTHFFPPLYTFLIVLLLLFSAVIFTAVIVTSIDISILHLNKDFLRKTTCCIFIVTIIFSIITNTLDRALNNVEYDKRIRNEDLSKLSSDFDKL